MDACLIFFAKLGKLKTSHMQINYQNQNYMYVFIFLGIIKSLSKYSDLINNQLFELMTLRAYKNCFLISF